MLRVSNRGIEPLPNLDFKFVCANTLIGLPKSQSSSLFDDHSGIAALSEIMSEYFSCNSQRKTEIRLKFINTQKEILNRTLLAFGKNIGELTQKLTTWDPFSNNSNSWFDIEWMFGLEEKFDIVIGNPPYHQLSKDPTISKEYKTILKDTYGTSGGRFNTYIFFIHFGIDILKNGGILSYIVPNTLLTQEYYKNTRQLIVSKMAPKIIVVYPTMQFQNAVIENITMILKKENNTNDPIQIIEHNNQTIRLLTTKEKSDFSIPPLYNFDLRINALLQKIINANYQDLIKYVEINQAIALKSDRMKSLTTNPDDGEFYKVIDGRNINKYSTRWNGVYLKYELNKIHSCKRKDIFLSDEKLFCRRVSSNLICSYDNEKLFALNTLVVINLRKESPYKLKFILALLNSRLLNYIYKNKYKSTKKVFSEIQARSLGMLPIAPMGNQEEIINLVDEIIKQKKNDLSANTEELQYKIDELVMNLYRLNEEEKEIIRKSDL